MPIRTNRSAVPFYKAYKEGLLMLAVERRNLILEKLQEDKKVIVSELSQEF